VEYEIINPSDHCTIVADDEKVAIAACTLLGEGAYGLRRVGDGETVVPPLLLATEEQTKQWLETFAAHGFFDWVTEHRDDLIACLQSFLYGDNRQAVEDMLAVIKEEDLRAAARAKWNDHKRSSLNNIGAQAEAIVKMLQESRAEADDDDRT
jgi:hypothetical protein